MQIVVDGILTNYQIVGNKTKPKLLVVHGWKRSLAEWLPTAQTLSAKFEVILLDLPGFGQTAMPKSIFSIYDYAIFVEHFLDKLGITKISFLGHSFGGRIGIILGATPRQAQGKRQLEKLILVDAAGIEKRSFIAKVKIKYFKVAKIFLPKRTIENIRQLLGSRDYKAAGALRPIFLKVINEDLSYLLGKINIPTLLMWGDKDKEVEEWKIKRMKEMIPHAKLRVVWGAGHDPHVEKSRDFLEILNEEIYV